MNNKLAGSALVLLALLVIPAVALITVVTGDADPTNRTEVEGVLRDIHDDRALFFAAVAFSIAADASLAILAAPAVYVALRNRDELLALVGAAGLIVAGVVFLAGDAANLAVGVLASDFVEDGSAGTIAAGDPVILQSARTFGLTLGMTEALGTTALGAGLLALGSLLALAPRGETNPPAWLGGLAALAGALLLGIWIRADAGLVLATLGYAGALLWFVLLGGWLIARRDSSAMATGSPRLAASV